MSATINYCHNKQFQKSYWNIVQQALTYP